MQTTRIPESVNQEIEKLNCKFVWGSNETKKKIHLVSWEKLCSSKEERGQPKFSLTRQEVERKLRELPY